MPNRLKILHIVFSLDSGGLENGVVNLCNSMDCDRFAPSICVFQGGGALESRVDTNRVDLFEVKRYWRYDPTLPFRLAKAIHHSGAHIVHTHSWGTLVEGLGGAIMSRAPVVIHGEHGLLEERSRNISIQRWLWSRADSVTAVAEELAERMAKVVRFPRARINVIHNGVDTKRFRPIEHGKASIRERFKLPTTGLIMGMVARLVPVKNHAGILHALVRLHTQGIDTDLVVAGDGPLCEPLHQLARTLRIHERVHFLGNVNSIEEVYQAIDIFVLNSQSEGMSNTILEAMASGLPVVATAVGANPQLVGDRETGYLVKINDVESLCRAIGELAGNFHLRTTMGQKGRLRAEDQYSVKRMVQDYSDLYMGLAQKSKLNGFLHKVITSQAE
jgi:sugar transferase (PEP-CTERM/EpsH1 system associated)